MSLNDIHLPINTVVDLYKNVLIESTESIPEKIKSGTGSINYLGNNKKHVIILVSYSDTVYLPDEQLNFLTSILTACKLSLDDIAIINIHRTGPVSFKELFKAVPAKSVLFFNVIPGAISLPINFPLFQVQSFDGINYLTAPALDKIEKDKTLKMDLWTSLKKIFKL